MSAVDPASRTTYFDVCASAGDLAAFVVARLDEYAEQAARGAGEGASCIDGASHMIGFKVRDYTPAGLLHFVAGWRRIVDGIAETYHGELGELPPVLLYFATAHRNHPGFKGDWLADELPDRPRLLLS